ncbi:MAG: hypothetical protein U0271_28075 [Polyangiaceae bacterium]
MNATMVRRFLAGGFALGVAAMMTASTVSAAKGSVTETSPLCQNATAVLLVGNSADAETHWGRIKQFFDTKKVWNVGEAKPGIAGTVSLVQWDIVHPYNGGPNAAFTARCGTGGTCNEVAKRFLQDYAEMQPAPIVFCGESVMLGNPSGR